MIEWYSRSWTEVVKDLKSHESIGLNNSQIAIIEEINGKNKIDIPKGKGIIYIAFTQFKKPWIILLLSVVIMFFYKSEIYLSAILGVMLLSNIFILTLEEFKEGKSLLEFEKLNSKDSLVVRNGKQIKISSEELVPGDIILLYQGDIVPADIRIIESNSLKVKEGAVTGQGNTVEKYSTKIEDEDINLNQMGNILFKTSIIIEGNCKGIVVETGLNTQIGNIISMLVEEKNNKYLSKEKLNNIMNKYSLSIICIIIAYVVIFVALKGFSKDILMDMPSVILAFIPENIFIMISLVSYCLIKYLKGKGIDIKNLSVIENLSNVSLIFEEKVGIISERSMQVEKIYMKEKILDFKDVYISNENNEDSNLLERILSIGLLCNDSKLQDGELINEKDDLIEIAIAKAAIQKGMKLERFKMEYPRILQIPFQKERRLMTTINKIDNNYRANIKGSTDALINRCTHILKGDIETELKEEDIINIKNADISMSNQGLNVIALAYRNFNYEPSLKENIESNLVFVGLIGIYNPIKENMKEIIKESKHMNIKPVIFTDENKITAMEYGKSIGILDRKSRIISGVEIDNIPEGEFPKIIDDIAIFSRIDTKHKTIISKEYKGYNTLMSGSRIKDLPYLKNAGVSISFGVSNIVRKLSEITWMNRDYESILRLIKFSRNCIKGINKSMTYILTCSICQGFVLLLLSIFNKDFFISPWKILWAENITILISAIAIMIDYNKDDIEYRQQKIDEKILKKNKGRFTKLILFVSVLLHFSMILLNKVNLIYVSGGELIYLLMNLIFIFYTFKFSENVVFKNKKSNIILLFNIIIQFMFMII
ncbi:cation-transporting P-type ATPase [Clostridium cochlearium]|uniref:Calcium-transporting ATPase n=1 Tax=Clostridium cochlearium TaxID=1494 RepID=A0A2X2W9W7_CLOCO|nr:cation-transporting P-type ATPase [Clostridium cochlearium]MBE6064634.1 cation-transporting P-type ATPase [Clostridium cochlearium]NMA58682.1 cation-transporting P-type ATPase [Clostridium cochlearium]SQB34433.1 calcium-transporting ATPase [Clostridium cochlearium]